MNNFTPFGNLQNPFYQCIESYYDVTSGILQSDPVLTGIGWVIPFPKRAGWVVSFGAGVLGPAATAGAATTPPARRRCLLSRADFAPYNLVATTHTPYLLELVADTPAGRLVQRYLLGDRDVLVGAFALEDAAPGAKLAILVKARREGGEGTVESGEAEAGSNRRRHLVFRTERDERYDTPPVRWEVPGGVPVAAATIGELATLLQGAEKPTAVGGARATGASPWTGEVFVATAVDPANSVRTTLTLEDPRSARWSPGGDGPRVNASSGLDGTVVYGRPAVELAAECTAQLPRLVGDFPAHDRNGFAYDFETTRLCTLPAVGRFNGPWPTWMSNMPRVVLAEGSLDLARLGYMDDRTARDAVLTMFRDTPGPNVPCLFASGGYNMVAADGTTCGTSPAWCIPFFNIYDLYLRTLDRDWVDELFPHLEALIDYWLGERTDEDGWLTYKCTWEAGEDNNPRIDPLATGDNVISNFVRPVELQASMAHAGHVLERFANVTGRRERAARYAALRSEYAERVHALWDPRTRRFRDWDKTNDRFVEVAGREEYWGADFTRQSPLSLVSLLFDTATLEQRRAMRSEVARFYRSPFTMWPSWATFVLEAASSLGMTWMAGEMAYDILRRVYAHTDRRSTGEFERPLPGASPEYWPHDWGTFGGNDAYAWGAQTSSFLIRHILGIRPTESTEGLGLSLSPSLPPSLRAHGSRFGVENLLHRGERVGVEYEVRRGDTLSCSVTVEGRAMYHTGEIANYGSTEL